MSRAFLVLLSVGAAASAFVGTATSTAIGAAEAAPAAPSGEAVARQVCTSCHAFPPPDILTRSKWSAKIFEMTGLALGGIGAPKGKEIPVDYPIEKIIAYYEGAAPTELAPPVAWPEPANAPVRFARHLLGLPGSLRPIVANVRLFTMRPQRGPEVFAADMSNGLVLRGSPARPEADLEIVARVPNPATPKPWTSTRTASSTSWWRTWVGLPPEITRTGRGLGEPDAEEVATC